MKILPVAFNIDRMQALGRSGVLREIGTSGAKEKTPTYIPALHVPLLAVPTYARFLEQLVSAGRIKIALVPPQPDPSALADAIEQHAFLGKLLLLAESSGTAPPVVPPCMPTLTIHRSPYPSASFDATSAMSHVQRFLKAMSKQIAETKETVALAIDDHGFADVIEGFDQSIINERAWALAVENFDAGSYAVDALVRKAIALHERVRLDVCRVAWAPAKPCQFSHLVAAGFDAIIETGALADASRGIYQLPDRSFRVQELTDLPCNCQHCHHLAPASGPITLTTLEEHVTLYCHNMIVALDEMARIRQELRLRTFRDHLETRNHGSGLLATFQRKLDARSGAIATSATDLAARARLNFIGADSYTRPEILRFRNKVINNFHLPSRTRWIILLPCSAHKPYSDSPSHARFHAAMSRGWKDWRRHCSELIITSPIGIIPRQLERCFPAAHYDVPVTGYWDEQELRFSAIMLQAIVSKHLASGASLQGIIAHVDGGYRAACELAARDMAIPVSFTGTFESATSREALDLLVDAMAALPTKLGPATTGNPRGSVQDEDTRLLVDYQLGSHGAGDVLFPGDIKMRPLQGDALQAIDRGTGQAMIVIDGESGHVTLDKQAIARLWQASLSDPGIKLKKVRFCDQKIAGSSIFPGGVDLADDDIAVGDDVFVHTRDGRVLAHGTAVVPGRRMKEMHGGPVVAISKKVEEK